MVVVSLYDYKEVSHITIISVQGLFLRWTWVKWPSDTRT